jgi:YHS domain-containing protein
MFWKLSALAIALLGVLASGLMAGNQDGPWQRAGRQNDSPTTSLRPAPSSGQASLLAEAKPTDKELIAQQKTCPVSDQPLGSMGKPVKVIYKGRTVFLCCRGCKKTFLADPEKYLKKLDEKK